MTNFIVEESDYAIVTRMINLKLDPNYRKTDTRFLKQVYKEIMDSIGLDETHLKFHKVKRALKKFAMKEENKNIVRDFYKPEWDRYEEELIEIFHMYVSDNTWLSAFDLDDIHKDIFRDVDDEMRSIIDKYNPKEFVKKYLLNNRSMTPKNISTHEIQMELFDYCDNFDDLESVYKNQTEERVKSRAAFPAEKHSFWMDESSDSNEHGDSDEESDINEQIVFTVQDIHEDHDYIEEMDEDYYGLFMEVLDFLFTDLDVDFRFHVPRNYHMNKEERDNNRKRSRYYDFSRGEYTDTRKSEKQTEDDFKEFLSKYSVKGGAFPDNSVYSASFLSEYFKKIPGFKFSVEQEDRIDWFSEQPSTHYRELFFYERKDGKKFVLDYNYKHDDYVTDYYQICSTEISGFFREEFMQSFTVFDTLSPSIAIQTYTKEEQHEVVKFFSTSHEELKNNSKAMIKNKLDDIVERLSMTHSKEEVRRMICEMV